MKIPPRFANYLGTLLRLTPTSLKPVWYLILARHCGSLLMSNRALRVAGTAVSDRRQKEILRSSASEPLSECSIHFPRSLAPLLGTYMYVRER